MSRRNDDVNARIADLRQRCALTRDVWDELKALLAESKAIKHGADPVDVIELVERRLSYDVMNGRGTIIRRYRARVTGKQDVIRHIDLLDAACEVAAKSGKDPWEVLFNRLTYLVEQIAREARRGRNGGSNSHPRSARRAAPGTDEAREQEAKAAIKKMKRLPRFPIEQYVEPRDGRAAEERAWMRDVVDRLPRQDREVIWLHVVEGLTYADIGQRLDISSHAAGRRCRRAKDQVHTEYASAFGDAAVVSTESARVL